MAIVVGVDQHRGQITVEWIDTETGEVQRTRVAPAETAALRGPKKRAKNDRADAGICGSC
jgi:hypothetical protein